MGSLRNIEVKNDGKTKSVFDVYSFLLRVIHRNARLQSGDVIFVPQYKKQ